MHNNRSISKQAQTQESISEMDLKPRIWFVEA